MEPTIDVLARINSYAHFLGAAATAVASRRRSIERLVMGSSQQENGLAHRHITARGSKSDSLVKLLGIAIDGHRSFGLDAT